jgi:transcriptional regulator with XRE-family HTH domain
MADVPPPIRPRPRKAPGEIPPKAEDRTAQFALALRQAWRRAGDPPYRHLAAALGYSPATISRIFDGRSLPRWKLVESLLECLGVVPDQVASVWRQQWIEAAEERRPIGAEADDALVTASPEQAHAENASELSTSKVSAPSGNTDSPPGQECRHCHAWTADLTEHQAWHWRMEEERTEERKDLEERIKGLERQLRRTTIRPVDDRGS